MGREQGGKGNEGVEIEKKFNGVAQFIGALRFGLDKEKEEKEEEECLGESSKIADGFRLHFSTL